MIISKYLLRYYPKGWSGLRTRVKDLNILNVGLDQSQLFYLVGRSIRQLFRSARTSYRTFDFRLSRPVRAKNPDHLYSLINHCRTTVKYKDKDTRSSKKNVLILNFRII